ncbi:MAG TPA: TlpA disulfide reductase family protein [Nitrospiraceae bacterium]|nr:TlpA disulfide reductase family protein [Nitrospiraceae bacterium]
MLHRWLMAGLVAMQGAVGLCEAGASSQVFERRITIPYVADGGVLKIGDEAPNFVLKDLEGFQVSLDQFRGKVVLLNFWATWCGPCRIEMPAMEQLYRSFSRKDFEILAVSTDPQGAAVTKPFQREMGFTFPVLHDADFRIGLRYGARTLPMTFLIDQQGVIRKRIFGARDWNTPEGRRLIQSLMGAS